MNRQLVLTLPAEVPMGRAELTVTVEMEALVKKRPRTSLAAWAEANSEDWGDRLKAEDVDGFTGRRF